MIMIIHSFWFLHFYILFIAFGCWFPFCYLHVAALKKRADDILPKMSGTRPLRLEMGVNLLHIVTPLCHHQSGNASIKNGVAVQHLYRTSDLLTWQDTTSDWFSVCGNTTVCSAAENEVKVFVQRKLQPKWQCPYFLLNLKWFIKAWTLGGRFTSESDLLCLYQHFKRFYSVLYFCTTTISLYIHNMTFFHPLFDTFIYFRTSKCTILNLHTCLFTFK